MNDPTFKLFIELMQVAIGIRSTLSSVPSQQEWQRLYGLMSKHTLIGIGCCIIIVIWNQTTELPLNRIIGSLIFILLLGIIDYRSGLTINLMFVSIINV